MKIVFISLCLHVTVFALPQNPHLVSGEFLMELRGDSEMQIHLSDMAQINWEHFNIAEVESVTCVQPTEQSIAVHNVWGGRESQILGKLSSNGRLVLINPEGIVFGKESSIRVGSLIASTLNCLDPWNHSGSLHFQSQSKGTIQQNGEITALSGFVTLFGTEVKQLGTIQSPSTIALFAGENFHFDPFNTPNSIREDSCGKLTHAGILQAGECALLLGETVVLERGASVIAQNSNGGGEIWIGGILIHGAPAQSPARLTCLEADVTIDASAKEFGSGGRIGIWADESVVCYAGLRSKGGAQTGNGGTIEISTRGSLDWECGGIDCTAPQGAAGLLIIDPVDIVITGAGVTTPGVVVGNPTTLPNLASVNIRNTSIQAALVGANVLINTTNFVGPDPGSLGNITVSAALTWATGFDLTLDAANDLTCQSTITRSGTGANLTLIAGRDVIRQVGSTINCTAPTTANTTITAGRDILHSAVLTKSSTNSSISYSAGRFIQINAASDITASGAGTNISLAAINNITILSNVRNTAAVALAIPCTVSATSTLGNINISSATNTQSVQFGAVNGAVSVSCCGTLAIRASDNASNFFAVVGNHTGISAGDINVNARNVTMQSTSFTVGGILGYTAITRLGVGQTAAAPGVSGNITVNTIEDIFMNSGAAGSGTLNASDSFIGHGGHNNTSINNKFGDITINTGRDCILNGGLNAFGNNRCIIGSDSRGDIRSIIRMNIGRDLILGTFANTYQTAYIGGGGGEATGNGYRQTLYINVGRDLMLDGRRGQAAFQPMNDNALPGTFPPVMSVRVAGNMILLGGNNNSATTAELRYHLNGVRPFFTEIFVLGNIVCYNGTTSVAALSSQVTASNVGSVDVRAAGDIHLAGVGVSQVGFTNGIFTPGFISYYADYSFAAADLWAAGGITPVTVCGTSIFSTSPLSAASPQAGGDRVGAIAFDYQYYNNFLFDPLTLTSPLASPAVSPFIYQTGLDITLNTTDQFAINGTTANLTMGGSAGEVLFRSLNGNFYSSGFFDTNIFNSPFFPTVQTDVGSITILTQNDMNLENAVISAGTSVLLVVDQQRPNRPFIGPGAFSMDAFSGIDSGTSDVGIYTALQSQNNIDPAAQFNGISISNLFSADGLTFGSTALYQNSLREIWCVYYDEGNSSPISPLTIFYKDCLQLVIEQAMIVVDQFLVDLHPYREFPGWESRFVLDFRKLPDESTVLPYVLFRRQFNAFNHPKTWTILLP